MTQLLDHLGKDTLPTEMVHAFVKWCIEEQARDALAITLERTGFAEIAAKIRATSNITALEKLSARARQESKQQQDKTRMMALSTAEAAAFEFNNMLHAANPDDLDAEAVSFFAARVSGWGGWASQKFVDVTAKKQAEKDAFDAQEAHLTTLWQMYASK